MTDRRDALRYLTGLRNAERNGADTARAIWPNPPARVRCPYRRRDMVRCWGRGFERTWEALVAAEKAKKASDQ